MVLLPFLLQLKLNLFQSAPSSSSSSYLIGKPINETKYKYNTGSQKIQGSSKLAAYCR